MEIPTTAEVSSLFTLYENLIQKFDYKSIAKLFSNKVVAGDPNGISFRINNFITRWQFEKRMKSFYEAAGLTNSRILRLSESKISNQFSLVNVSWEATFRKTQLQPFEFHVSYIVRKRRSKAEIVMIIVHEDERKILEGYGIITK